MSDEGNEGRSFKADLEYRSRQSILYILKDIDELASYQSWALSVEVSKRELLEVNIIFFFWFSIRAVWLLSRRGQLRVFICDSDFLRTQVYPRFLRFRFLR